MCFRLLVGRKGRLACVGLLSGCLGAIAYTVTGLNGVWGTTMDAIPVAIKDDNACVLLALPKDFISSDTLAAATAAEFGGGIGPYSLLDVKYRSATGGRELAASADVLFVDIDLRRKHAITLSSTCRCNRVALT